MQLDAFVQIIARSERIGRLVGSWKRDDEARIPGWRLRAPALRVNSKCSPVSHLPSKYAQLGRWSTLEGQTPSLPAAPRVVTIRLKTRRGKDLGAGGRLPVSWHFIC
jgi:hypothetical protein